MFMLENVCGFMGSDAHALAMKTLRELGYENHIIERSPADFGVPMRRPRLYLVATADGVTYTNSKTAATPSIVLKDFVDESYPDELIVAQRDFEKYAPSLHIVRPGDVDAYATCFTSGYWKSYRASGTFIEVDNGKIRRFSPDEIVALMGFSATFAFPEQLTLQAKLQLAGNTVDVRSIEYILDGLSNLN